MSRFPFNAHVNATFLFPGFRRQMLTIPYIDDSPSIPLQSIASCLDCDLALLDVWMMYCANFVQIEDMTERVLDFEKIHRNKEHA